MSTVTAAGWSGLVNDVHGTTYETVGEKLPQGGRTGREMQKRGNFSLSKLTGAAIQLSRAVIDAAQPAATHQYKGGTSWNDGTVGDPSDSTGQGPVDEIDIINAVGGDRGVTLINTVPVTDAVGEAQVFDTTITHAYVADSGGNGGDAMTANAPNAAQP